MVSMRQAHTFEHDGWHYQIIELPSLNRAQLWFKAPWDTRWNVGHGKDIPSNQSFGWVAKRMEWAMRGIISMDEYNSLLSV